MTISFIVKKPKAGFTMDDMEGGATIYVRLRDGRALDSTITSGYSINPLWWDAKREEVKAGVRCCNEEMVELNGKLQKLKMYLYSRHRSDKDKGMVNKEWLAKSLKSFAKEQGKVRCPASVESDSFKNRFQEFLDAHDFSEGRLSQYRVVERAVLRFQEFMRMSGCHRKNYVFDVHTVDETDLIELYDFMAKEHIYCETYPAIYGSFPEKRQPKPRGANTLSENFKKLRAFFNWAQKEKIIMISPFSRFKCEKELYGTPYYLSTEEMHKILNTDLSASPEHERQRDVFIFHCCIGCRVGDLLRLTKADVIDGGIEYIATKTIADNARTVRVPLNDTAMTIIDKYKNYSETKLLPFTSPQRYNASIKTVLTMCGITRLVTVLNSLTRKEEKIPINEVGSSHMARRTFIANIYNKVQDPNVIGSMTGHVEGSHAFSRYRTIEENVKKSLVDILG